MSTETKVNRIKVLDRSGDSELVWSPEVADQKEKAAQLFEKMTTKGYAAFAMKEDGSDSRIVDHLEDTYELVIFVPQLVGG